MEGIQESMPIRTSLSQLAALQQVDREVREKGLLMETLSADVLSLEQQLATQREATRAVIAERDALDSRRRLLEAQLEDEESKMKDRRMRLNRVRNEKELQALRREIEVGKEANLQMEEEILRLLESLEGLQSTAAAAEQMQVDLEGSTTEQLRQHRARIELLRQEVESAKVQREEMASSLEPSLLRKYDQIFARRAGVAVVEVRNMTCLGCHMNLPPQFYNELLRAEDVRLCPSCHRILYWRNEPSGE